MVHGLLGKIWVRPFLPLPEPGAELHIAGEGGTPKYTEWKYPEGLEDASIWMSISKTGYRGI